MKRMVFFYALACGRLNGDDTISGGGPVTLDQFPAQGAHTICTRIFECCDANEQAMLLAFGQMPITTEPQCESAYDNAIGQGLVPEIDTSIANGSASYDADAAGACLAVLASESCPAFGSAMEGTASASTFGCSPFLIANRNPGEPCQQSYECTTQSCINNACEPIPSLDEPCTGQCQPGQFCGFDPMKGEICELLQPNNASCGSDGECESFHCVGSGSTGGSGSGSCESGPPLCDGV